MYLDNLTLGLSLAAVIVGFFAVFAALCQLVESCVDDDDDEHKTWWN